MWTQALILFVVLQGGFTKDVDCNVNPAQICTNFTPSIPKREELLKTCNDFKSDLKCLLNLMKSCRKEEKEILKLGKAVAYLEQICVTTNPVYRGVFNSFDCVMPIFFKNYDECKKTDDRKAMVFFEYLIELDKRGIKKATNEPNGDVKGCIDNLYFKACSSSEVGKKCGAEARNAVVDIIQNLDNNIKKTCNQEIIDDLMRLVTLFEKAGEDTS